MSDRTSIEWTDATWNPTRGCSLVSEGCRFCYAMKVAGRWAWGRHLTKKDAGGNVTWNGDVELVESVLRRPLSWRAPKRIFVDSESDLFHDKVPDEWLDRVFAVMALASRHTFQILTKRPERMRKYLALGATEGFARAVFATRPKNHRGTAIEWPLPNVWLGVSVEDQATADDRIPKLLLAKAALRFVSYEPALGPIDFDQPRCQFHDREEVGVDEETGEEFCNECALDGSGGELAHGWWLDPLNGGLAWIIVGGESGSAPGVRDFNVEWARSTIAQCRGAGVPVFVKQMGKRPTLERWTADAGRAWTRRGASVGEAGSILLRDRKGGDMAEWADDLRVREFPSAPEAEARA